MPSRAHKLKARRKRRSVLPDTRREVYSVRLPPTLVERVTPHGPFTAIVEAALTAWLDRR